MQRLVLLFLFFGALTGAQAGEILCWERIAQLDAIQEGLFLSAAPVDEGLLRSQGIEAVVKTDQPWESRILVGVPTFSFPFTDGKAAELSVLVSAVVQIARLRAEGKKVLVYCGQGVSRSATVVALYLMHSLSCTWEEGVQILQQARPFVQPHPRIVSPEGRRRVLTEVRAQLGID